MSCHGKNNHLFRQQKWKKLQSSLLNFFVVLFLGHIQVERPAEILITIFLAKKCRGVYSETASFGRIKSLKSVKIFRSKSIKFWEAKKFDLLIDLNNHWSTLWYPKRAGEMVGFHPIKNALFPRRVHKKKRKTACCYEEVNLSATFLRKKNFGQFFFSKK